MDDDPEERRETLALVIDELDRMSRMVNDLLTSRRPSGRTSSSPRPSTSTMLSRECSPRRRRSRERDWRLDGVGRGDRSWPTGSG